MLSNSAGKSQTIKFLLSADNSKLIHQDLYDLKKDPAENLNIAGRPSGNPAAKVTVVNFDDLECPYCARMHQEIFPGTAARYKDTVRFIYKDNPLVASILGHARAVDSNCLAPRARGLLTYVDYLQPMATNTGGQGPGEEL